MKPSTWWVCVLGVLALATVGLSEIVPWDDYSYDDSGGGSVTISSSVSHAYAESEGDGYVWAGAQGWESATTTEACVCDWGYYSYGYAFAGVWWDTVEECYAEAWTQVEIDASFDLSPPADPIDGSVCISEDK